MANYLVVAGLRGKKKGDFLGDSYLRSHFFGGLSNWRFCCDRSPLNSRFASRLSQKRPTAGHPMNLPVPLVCSLLGSVFLGQAAFAFDAAEILSRQVPGQAYGMGDRYTFLDRGKNRWAIPLWACDPASLKIVKVLGSSAPAAYAIEITVSGRERIEAADNVMRLRNIHLLATSLPNAIKMRRALIAEIDTMQRQIERQEKRPPGYLKRLARSQMP
ncbi:MAG: hypothetical protein M3Z22_04325 [Verrucomicrobiota bacterium]|nr:hypothetical protein [Verrucomicrobiota bacterium]